MRPYLFPIIVCLLLAAQFTFAQESLESLRHNSVLLERYQDQQKLKSASRDVEIGEFNYVIDTLPLPFFDDFAKDRMKRYNASKSDDNVTPLVTYAFEVSEDHPDTFSARYDTTFNSFKYLNGTVEFEATPALELVRFDLVTGESIDTTIVWTNIISEFDEALGIVSFDTLPAEYTQRNSSDTLFNVADDKTLWVTPVQDTGDRGAFINNSFARNMLTQGVATLDGTDAAGYPYDISDPETYGFADELESKPLAIDSEMVNVYITFSYQAGGFGNIPNPVDSLILEFYAPEDDEWSRVWSAGGVILDDSTFSEQIYVPIDGGEYLRGGFKFRFRNYATLSGSLDHWHIDYVRVDQNRDTLTGDTIFDVAFLQGPVSYLESYTSVPYNHYLEAWDQLQRSEIDFSIRNLGPEQLNVSPIVSEVSTSDGVIVSTVSNSYPNVDEQSIFSESIPLAETQIFPDLGTTNANFFGKSFINATANGNSDIENDTIINRYSFHDYYAYDDGTAEMAYTLTGAGLKLAYRFVTPVTDTLKAIRFNFPQGEHDDNPNLPMKLIVWSDDINTTPIFESEFTRDATYTNANEFVRYELEEPVVVNGTFYIGYQQIEPTKIYIGYDVNTNSSENLFYQVSGVWYPAEVKGSLMMRPDFGNSLYPVGTKKLKNMAKKFNVYPNPAVDQFTVQFTGENDFGTLEIYSIEGRLVDTRTVSAANPQVPAGHIPNGLYILRFTDSYTGRASTARLVVGKP